MQQEDRQTRIHYHIRWPDKLDWERFETETEASARATELVQPGETYRIEEFDGLCTVCGQLIGKFARAESN